ncbi:hypothetical protein [Burkholderia gladioli]|uniref:hypothetical protein n=1 Tax=Burkholderia gladioli TaxID=28095 RepID=UPI003D23A637
MAKASQKKLKWQDLERMVRVIAEIKFSAPARAEDIAGVKCDCVIHLDDGSAVIVEVSKEDDIDKLRKDINKFNTVRPHFFSRNIFPKCHFVTIGNPTPSLIEAGKAANVLVFSVEQYFNFLLGHENYKNVRRKQAFGSAVDLYSGEPDLKSYVAVNYFSESGDPYSVAKIAEEIVQGKVVVLIGDYGSGKSRCVKEIFEYLSDDPSKSRYHFPIAINLKENWGLKRATEFITRHFTDLGLIDLVQDSLKTAFSPASIFLLDGFDEIGAQTWSDDPTKLVEIRKQSLVGVKDIIQRAKGGVLITGREHYFNNDAELLECLGLGQKDVLFLRCNQELTGSQFSEMVGRTITDLPAWVPKKPLIGTIIRDMEPSIIDSLFSTSTGQIDFWDILLTTFCEREAKINPILDPIIIRSLYSHIGRLSRTTKTALGPIAIRDINEAFEKTTGRPPTDESAIILQRLPGLSRIGAESLDRQFVDTYILDGLKAEDLLTLYGGSDSKVLNVEWKHPIESFGAFYVATRIESIKQIPAVVAFIKRHHSAGNRVLLSDLLSSLFLCDGHLIDFGGLIIEKGRFHAISLSSSKLINFNLNDCYVGSLDITDADPQGINLMSCVIDVLDGVADEDNLPPWISNPAVGQYQSVSTLAAIRQAGLSVAQTFLLTSLRKLFLQPGAGRKESSMYKGFGDSTSKKICEKVISALIHYKFCTRFKGSSEETFLPNRSLTPRARAIMNQMTLSKDELWAAVSRIEG